jgi:hypothetical protein
MGFATSVPLTVGCAALMLDGATLGLTDCAATGPVVATPSEQTPIAKTARCLRMRKRVDTVLFLLPVLRI